MSETKDSEPDRSQPDKQMSRAERERQEKVAREQMLRVIFTTEARERLSNIRMVRPDLAESIENQLFELAASGRLKKQITDEELKQMLGSFQRPKREFKINWK
jgi:programmed cell death protein 5